MTPQPTDLYAGLDQMIARPTRQVPPEASGAPERQEPEREETVATAIMQEHRQTAAPTRGTETATGVSLSRRLEPEPPESPALYRKQTLQFGPKELDAVQSLQMAMAARGREVSKNDLVRAAVEFLAKDFAAQQDDSYVVRKFWRR